MRTTNDNIINLLDDYISCSDKEWKKRCIPSSEDAIDKLKIYTKMNSFHLDFPKDFIDFICFAGESDSGLFDAINGKIDINTLLCENQDLFENWQDEIDPTNFEFLVDDVGVPYVINFNDYQKIWYENECAVSSSFGKFLLQCAIRKYERTKYRYQISLSFSPFLNTTEEPDNILKLKKKLSEEYDLVVRDYSDEFFWYAKSSQISMYIRTNAYSNSMRYMGMICLNDVSIIDDIIDELKKINDCFPKLMD